METNQPNTNDFSKVADSEVFAFGKFSIWKFFLIFAAQTSLGWLGLNIGTLNTASPIWPATGVAIVVTYCFGAWALIPIFAAAFTTSSLISTPLPALIGIATGSALEAYLGSMILKSISSRNSLKNYTELFGIFLASMASPLIAATFGAASLFVVGILKPDDWVYTWYTWWSGDAIGAMIVLPLASVVYSNRNTIRLNSITVLDTIKLLSFIGILISAITLIFHYNLNQAFIWLLVPAILFFAAYHGHFMGRFSVLIMTAMLVALIRSGYGPFEFGKTTTNLIYIQALLFTCAISVLFSKSLRREVLEKRRFAAGILAGWALATTIIYAVSKSEMKQTLTDLESTVSGALASLIAEEKRYQTALHGVEAALVLKDGINEKQFHGYVERLDSGQNYGAVNGFGFVKFLEKSQTEKYLSDVKRNYKLDNFAIRRLDEEYSAKFSDQFVITLVEPIDRNRVARGLDLGSEVRRRTGAEKARESNTTTATTSIQLVQDKVKRPGFLIFHPIKGDLKNGVDTFWGWSYAPVISDVFFSKSLEHYLPILGAKIEVDGETSFTSDKFPKTVNRNSLFYKQVSVSIFNLNHKIAFFPSESFFSRHSSVSVPLATLLNVLLLVTMAFISEILSFAIRTENLIKQRTAELEESKIKMVQSSKLSSLGEMAGGIAHEINNPLSIIQSKSRTLKKRLDAGTDLEKCKEDLALIERTTDRIAKIIRGLRTFARNSEGDPMLPNKVGQIVADTLELCQERFKNHQIELRVNNAVDADLECRAAQISQVLMNLLGNAHDAVEHLPEKWVELNVTGSSNKVRISVVDSGKGIAPEVVEKLMQPFFTTKGVGKGTGLGLSISKGIIEEHHGRFIYDQDSANTRFVIDLPLKQPQKTEAENKKAA